MRLSKIVCAFGATFLFSIVHALYHVHIQPNFVSTPGHSHCNLITAPSIIYVRGCSFNEVGARIFSQKPKRGSEFFLVGKGGGDQNFFAYTKGGPEKIGDQRSQTDGTPSR